MASSLLLSLRDINLSFGGKPVLSEAELVVATGDRISLVGRNGSGKSSLLKIATGLLEPESGECAVTKGVSIRYLSQEPDLSGFQTTLAYVTAGLGTSDDPHRARLLLGPLGFDGTENPETLSGGEARRCALARVLAPEPDILLLDEPTNHLDLPAIQWMEDELRHMRSALVVVSHDRRLLTRVTTSAVWLDRGITRRLNSGFDQFESWRDEILRQEEADLHKLGRKIVAEEHWVRYGVSGRRKRNQKRLGDLDTLRRTKAGHQQAPGSVEFTLGEEEESGRLMIEAKSLNKSWGSQTVVRDFSLRITRGDRIGIVGPNGAGKTTLVQLLTGSVAPDTGSVRLGTNLQTAVLDQTRTALDPNQLLQESIADGQTEVQVGGGSKHVLRTCRTFCSPQRKRVCRSENYRGVNGGGYCWPAPSPGLQIFWCWMSRPTTWIWKHWIFYRTF
jgi:ATP-binding cassette subfamily F protein uup